MSGGLNMQIEHHLFPTVCHCHLRAIKPIVVRYASAPPPPSFRRRLCLMPAWALQMRLCKKHGVPYAQSHGYRDAFRKHFSHTEAMSERPAEEKLKGAKAQ